MNRRLFVAFVLMIALPLPSLPGLRLVEKHDGWQLTAGTKVTGYATYDECLKAIRVLGPGDYKCKDVTSIKAEFTCDDVPMPAMKTVVNAQGFLEQPGIVIEALPDGTWGPTKEEGFVKGPGFPNCWVPGLVPYTGEWHAPDGPPDLAPGAFAWSVDYATVDPNEACPVGEPPGCFVPKHALDPPAPPPP